MGKAAGSKRGVRTRAVALAALALALAACSHHDSDPTQSVAVSAIGAARQAIAAPVTSVKPGTQDVTVPKQQTQELATGSYRHLLMEGGSEAHNTILILTGSNYIFQDIVMMDNHCVLQCRGPCTIEVADSISCGTKSRIGPAGNSCTNPGDVTIVALGADGSRFDAIDIGHEGVQGGIYGVAYAPNGTIRIGNNGIAHADLHALHVVLGTNVVLQPAGAPFGGAQGISDGNACTADSCDFTTGAPVHTPVPVGTSCNDGNACNGSDTCSNGTCVGGAPPNCDDGSVCTIDSCNATIGCQHVAAPATTVCRAAAGVCDEAETCGGSTVCPADAKSTAVCRPAAGQCDVAERCNGAGDGCPADGLQANGTTCDDGNACTQSDACQAGTCTGTNPVVCSAADPCHVAGTCDPASGACSSPAVPSGTTCTDGNPCTVGDSCHGGACASGSTVNADDGNPCTIDFCSPTGAAHTPVAAGASCSDGNSCNGSETCDGAGHCAPGVAVVCIASDLCHAAGACDPTTGACSNPAKADGTACTDGDPCTQTDMCQAGACTSGTPVVCTAQDQCHAAGTCDHATGACVNPAKADGTSCSDGSACTQTDTCQAGACTGSNPVVCTAGDQCHTAGACDPATGVCSNPSKPNGAACDDGSSCTETDTCQAGGCTGSNPVVCPEPDPCHAAGTCDAATGQCSNPAKADGSACEDGNGCTTSDTCKTGTCSPGAPVACSALDQCHAPGVCDPTTGACSDPAKPNGSACNDGNGCTRSDACTSGTCTGSDPVTCTAADPCHVPGACDPGTGQCSSPPAANGTPCNDGNACTQTDACQAGACAGSNPVTCPTPDACHTAGTCGPTTGVCSSPPKPNPFFDRIFEATSYSAATEPIFELAPSGNTVFATVNAGGWVGPIHITPSGKMWVVTNAFSGSLWDITAGGNLTGATPVVKNLFPLVGFLDGFDLDSQGNAYVTNSEVGVQPIAIVAPNGTVTYTSAKYNSPSSLLVAETRSCSPAKTLYIGEGGTGRVLAHDLATNVDTAFATGFSANGTHVSAQMVMTAQARLLVLWGNSHGAGLFDITAGGNFSGVAPMVTAPFRIDVNQCAVNSAGSIFCAGDSDGNSYVSTRISGVQQPFTVFRTGLGDTESVAVGPAAGPSGTQPIVSVSAPAQVDVGANAHLVATVTESGLPPGDPITSLWTTISGPGVASFSAPTQSTTDATFSVAGSYVVQFTASDGVNSASALVRIAVGPNQPPTVSAGAGFTAAMPAANIALYGGGSDDGLPVGSTLQFQWTTKIGPASAVFANPTAAITTVTFPTPGTYQLELSATDSQYTSQSVLVATIVPPDLAPQFVGVTVPTEAAPTGTAHLSATVTDDGLPVGSSVSLKWSRVSGPGPVTFTAPSSAATDATFGGVAGTYVIQVAASDGELTSTTQRTIYVLVPGTSQNQRPLVSAGPSKTTSVATGVTLNGAVFDDGLPAGSPLTALWSVVSGPGSVALGDASQPVTTATFSLAGTYLLQLTANDGQLGAGSQVAVAVDTAASANLPPVVDAGPNTAVVPPGATAMLLGTASDDGNPAGSTLDVTWTQISGPAVATFVNPKQAASSVTVPPPSGVYVFRLTASDSVFVTSADMTVTVVGSSGQNQAPVVSAGEAFSLPGPMSGVPLHGTVTDDGLPFGVPFQSEWIWKSGPAPVTFADPTSPTSTATFPLAGQYVLWLIANDSQKFAVSSVFVSVAAPTTNLPPFVTAQGPSTVNLPDPASLGGTVYDDSLPVGGTLAVQWTKLSGPGAVAFSSPTQVSTLASFATRGIYILQLAVNDGALTSTSTVTVTAAQGNQRPTVNAGADQVIAATQGATTLVGAATDDGLPDGSVLSYEWSVVSGPSNATFGTPTQATTTATFAYPGAYVLRLSVSDSELVATDDVTVTVQAPSGGTPTVAIAGLQDDGLVTAPIQVLGTISEGAWNLDYRLGGRDDVSTPYRSLASGIGAVNGAVLGTFDPTLLLNGIYTVRLFAKTTAGETSTSLAVSVEGRMKVGNFTLAFTDLDVPVAGLPIQLIRTYDSRDKRVGDFGVGWNLTIRDVRVEKSGKIGAYWRQVLFPNDFFPIYCLEPSKSASVTITMPTGRVYRFRPRNSSGVLRKDLDNCQLIEPITTANVVWESVSDPDSKVIALTALNSGSTFVQGPAPGPVQLLNFSDFEPWDPRVFSLTTEDGTVYDIDQDIGVIRVTDRHGNTLDVTPHGLLHSSGKSVPFERDALGRITKITDPNGQAMTYAYDARGDLTAYVDRGANSTTFTYAGDHFLQDIFDPLGRRPIRNEYDASGRLLKHIDALGHEIVYTHDPSANSEEITDRLGFSTFYQYNQMGDVVRKTDPLGNVWLKSYDRRGNVLTEADPLGHTVTRTFDGMDDQLTETDALGKTSTYTYNDFRQLLTSTDPLGHATTNVYDNSGNQLSTADPLGNVTTYTSDEKGNRLTETDALGHVTSHTYDSTGNQTTQTDALGHATAYTYDPDNHKLTEMTIRTTASGPEQLVTSYTYDANGRLTQTTSPGGATRQTVWTATGKRAASVDELGHTTAYTYDDADRLVTTTYPDGATEAATYDAENRRLTSTDAAAHTMAYAYDAAGRQTATTNPDASSRTTTYDDAGNVVATTDELGKTTTYALDANNRRVSTTDPLGRVTQTVYDAAGRQTATLDALGHSTVQTYDAADRVTLTTHADGSTIAIGYDALGRQTTKTDELGRITTFGYDALGRLTSVKDALNQTTQYAYDEVGNRTSQTDASGHVTAFEYDSRGREIRRTLPDGKYEAKGYDAAGRLQSKVDFAGRLITYAYDTRGRLVGRSYADGSSAAFTYTPDGQRATAVDARGITAYSYDARHHVTHLGYPDGAMLDYGYDARGARTSLASHLGSQVLTTIMTYDDAGQPDHVTDPMGRLYDADFDAAGNRTAIAYPNTTRTTYAYDTRNRLTNLTTQQVTSGLPGVLVQSQANTLDAAGRRTAIAEGDGTSRSYGYDSIDRLTSEAVTGGAAYTRAFTYDAVGNRATQTKTGVGTGTTSYGYDNRDRLLTENATTYAYDSNGNLTSKSADATYTWDLENRLISVVKSDGSKVDHVYDVDGNRVRTTVTPANGPARTTRFLVDTAGGLSQVVADVDGATGALAALYVRLGDELLAVMRPDGHGGYSTRWVHHDGIGSVRALTDESGVTTDAKSYEAFGTVVTTAGTDPLPYGFAGEAYDGTSGLAYHRARWMDARVGRFLGMDAARGNSRRPLTLHPFAYAGLDPVLNVDPTGEETLAGFSAASVGFAIQATISLSITLARTVAITCGAQLVGSFLSPGDTVQRGGCKVRWFNLDFAPSRPRSLPRRREETRGIA